MADEFIQLENLVVQVEQVVFVPTVSDPPLRPYGFVYFISIENNTPHTVQMLARKWIVKEQSGEVVVVEGDGIVGERPVIEPGDAFSYNSCHVTGGDAVARGAFFGAIQGTEKKIVAPIPEFDLKVP